MTLKRFIMLSTLCVILSGCFGDSAEKARDAIDSGRFNKAHKALDKALGKKPKDPLLNGLKAEALVKECIETKCHNDPTSPLMFDKHLRYAIGSIFIEKKPYNPLEIILTSINSIKDSTDKSNMLMLMIDSTQSGGLKNRLIPHTLETLGSLIEESDTDAAAFLLSKISKNKKFPEHMIDMTNAISGMIQNDISQTKTSMANIRKWREIPRYGETLLPVFVKTLTQTVGQDVKGSNLLLNGKGMIQLLDIPIFKIPEVSEQLSIAYSRLRDAPFILKQFENGTLVSDIKPIENSLFERGLITIRLSGSQLTYQKIPEKKIEISEQDKKKFVQIFMTQTALSFNLNNLENWQAYLEDIIILSERYKLPDMLLYSIEPERVPSNIVAPYNAYLLGIIRRMVNTNENAVPFLTKLILNSDNEENLTVQAEELIKMAMDKAIEEENYELIHTYGVFNPKVAQISKQKIITSIIDGLEKKWGGDDFEGMMKLSNFLNKNMGIEFNLNNFLLQKFDEYLSLPHIKEKLNGSMLSDFLTMRILKGADLGAKAKFTSERLKDTPAVFNASLKNAIIAAGDGYNVAHTLLKLQEYFYEDDFSKEEQRTYAMNALKAAISSDKSLGALEIALKGEVLRKIFPEMAQSFFLNQALNRLSTPDDSALFWKHLPQNLKDVVISIRPQFVYMLEALDAFSKGERTLASEKISLISDDQYMKHLQPIVNDIRIIVRKNQGTYIMKDLDADIPLLVMKMETIDNPNHNDFSQIQTVKATFLNKIGSITIKSDKDLTLNSGNVYAYSMIVPYDVDKQSLIISNDAKTTSNLPVKFNTLYGDIQSVEFENGRIFIKTSNGKSYEMRRITEKIDVSLLPNGRYAITNIHSDSNDAIEYSLPNGTIFQFKTLESDRIHDAQNNTTLYPIEGLVLHPANNVARTVNGYYSPNTHTSLVNYSYQLQDGGQLFASAKCQIVEDAIFCAVNNKFMSRSKYSHIVSGQKARLGSMNPANLIQKRGLLPPPAN